jgi:DMSO/TMAO reductase YedYZ molybdopterin-dependent catalytic subunit
MDSRTSPITALSRRAALVGAAQAVALLAAACTSFPEAKTSAQPAASSGSPAVAPSPASPTATPPAVASATGSTAAPVAAATPSSTCMGALPAVTRPTPIPYPGYTAQEPSTKLHVTAPPQVIELETYRLAVKGKVVNELSLTYDELRCLPKIGEYSRIECPGFFVDWSNLAGASLASVLALAEPLEGAKLVELTGVDGRGTSFPLVEGQNGGYFLAYEWEGEPLPASHGFPIRAAVRNSIGGYWIKWLTEIKIS